MINLYFTIASNKFGYGHLRRCEIISEKFNYDKNFIILLNEDLNFNSLPKHKNINYFNFVDFKKLFYTKDLNKIIKYIFLDFANLQFIKMYKRKLNLNLLKNIGKKVILLDDLSVSKFYQNIDLKNFNSIKIIRPYSDKKNKGIISGEKFSIINEKLKKYKKKSINYKMKNVLISFGGSDLNNYSIKVLKSLKGFNLSISLIVGPFFKKKNIKLINKFNSKIKLIKNKNFLGPNFKKSDLVITSCGITKYELAALNIPSMIIPISKSSEKKNYYFSKLGTAISLKYNPNIRLIRNNILELKEFKLRKLLFKSCSKVDFLGLKRIIKTLNLKK